MGSMGTSATVRISQDDALAIEHHLSLDALRRCQERIRQAAAAGDEVDRAYWEQELAEVTRLVQVVKYELHRAAVRDGMKWARRLRRAA